MFRSLRMMGHHLLKQHKFYPFSPNYRNQFDRKPKIYHHEVFIHERDLCFAKCFILGGAQVGTKYYPTVKEKHYTYQYTCPEGMANKKVIENCGASVRVRFNIDHTLPRDQHKIKKMPKRQKFRCVYYINSTGETKMLDFFTLCSRILKDKGEVHMIVEESDFKSLNLENVAATVNIFVKKAIKVDENYCKGYSPPHVNVDKAKVYIFELDETRKASAQLAEVEPGNQQKELTVITPETEGTCSRIQRGCETELGLLSQNVKAFNPQLLIPMRSAMPHNFEKALVDLRSQASARVSPGLLCAILPETKGTSPRIKRLCETELGIVSQFCKPRHVMNTSGQDLEDVSQNFNVKVLSACLNGRLPYVTDVTHPQPGKDSNPSIAAVVASMEHKPHVTKYNAIVSAQPHRQETMQDLYPKTGVIHGGLIRDGVSEGQFSEMDKTRKACISLEENYMPPDGLQMLTDSLCYTYARCIPSVSSVPPAYYAHLAAFRARWSYIEGDQSDSSSRG